MYFHLLYCLQVQELCERDRIIEEKQSQIEQQNKVLVEIQITLDEKQRQIEALRSSLAARDSSIADLEGRLAKAKANVRNLEAKLDASVHEANRLREEVIILAVFCDILFRLHTKHLSLVLLLFHIHNM
jgi:septal ring factor EnvC (AmiA/AmiB activator)